MEEISPHANDNVKAGFPLFVGYLSLLALLGGLGYWSIAARISGAVVSSGIVQVENNRQVVQHLNGGVVGAILAKNGDFVEAGQVLIEFDDTRFKSELAVVESQIRELDARSARLEAERDKKESITFPEELLGPAESDSAAARQIRSETTLFETRRVAMAQQTEQLAEQIMQIENRVEGIRSQLNSLTRQEALISAELKNQQLLMDRGLAQASRVLELRSTEASLQGQAGKLTADIAELKGQKAGIKIELLKLETSRHQEIISELRDIQYTAPELAERRASLLDTLVHLKVRAPVDGIVHGSNVFALQSVVRAGAPIMYVIPQDKSMLVAARVDTQNIDSVHIGQEATLRFTVFDQRRTPDVQGHVTKISADVVTDEVTGQSYYAVDLMPSEDAIMNLGEAVLLPGMPVEAFIKTGDRSPLVYLTEPLTDYFVRAFRE